MNSTLAAAALLVSIGGVVLTIAMSRWPLRVRPTFDLIRLAISVATVLTVTAAASLDADPAVVAVSLVVGTGSGFVIGQRAEIWADGGALWFRRAGLGLIVWAASTVLIQAAAIADRSELLDVGRTGSWFGICLQLGVILGRTAPAVAARAAAAGAVMVAVLATAPQPDRADAQSAPSAPVTEDRWVLAATDVAPMDGFTSVSHDAGLYIASIDDPGFAVTFFGEYVPPPEVLEPGSVLESEVLVDGVLTLGEVQQYASFSVIQYVERIWTDESVGVRLGCTDPIGSDPLTCDEEVVLADGTFVWSIPSGGESFEIGVGVLNCDCSIHWRYEFEAGVVEEEEPLAEAEATDDDLGTDVDVDDTDVDVDTATSGEDPDPVDQERDDVDELVVDATDDLASAPRSTDLLEFPDEPDEDQVGAAGAAGTAAVAALTLVDAIDARRRRDRGRRVGGSDTAGDWDAEGLFEPDPTDGSDLVSVERSGSAFERDIAEWIEQLPPPGEGQSIEPLLDMIQAAFDQMEYWNRPFEADELRRVWDALGEAVERPGRATERELRESIASLLDRNVAGMPVWLAAWALRDPVAAAETIVRMSAAYATGGASELPLIPFDVYRDIDAAKQAAAKRGEALTFGDAFIAGARGQAMGWVFDGAGLLGAGGRSIADGLETVGDAATGARRATADGAEAGLETVGERAAGRIGSDWWPGLENARPGSKIPAEHIREAGYTPHQMAELRRVAAEENVIIGTRTTNPDSTKFIENGTAVPKPIYMKAKTINELDAALGGPPASTKGQVGFFKPNEPPDGADAALRKRYLERRAQYDDLEDVMRTLEADGVIKVRDGVVHKVLDDGTTKPFAGDIDAVAVLDGKTGKPLTGRRYAEVIDKLKASGAMLQHGAESNIVSDIVRAKTRGLDRNSPEFAEAFDAAYESATKLGAKLNQNHLDGIEQTIWTHARGSYKGPQTNKLAGWQEMTLGDVPLRPVDAGSIGLPQLVDAPVGD